MNQCPQCGAQSADASGSCAVCGFRALPGPATNPPRAQRRIGLFVAAGVVVAVAVVGGVLLLAGGDDERPSAGAPGSTTAIAAIAASADDSAAQAAAAAELSGYAAESTSIVPDLADLFVVQIARHDKGADGESWEASEALRTYLEWRERFMALLVDASTIEFAASDGEPAGDAYFVFAPVAFATEAAAEQWCQDQALAEEHCRVRKIKPRG